MASNANYSRNRAVLGKTIGNFVSKNQSFYIKIGNFVIKSRCFDPILTLAKNLTMPCRPSEAL